MANLENLRSRWRPKDALHLVALAISLPFTCGPIDIYHSILGRRIPFLRPRTVKAHDDEKGQIWVNGKRLPNGTIFEYGDHWVKPGEKVEGLTHIHLPGHELEKAHPENFSNVVQLAIAGGKYHITGAQI